MKIVFFGTSDFAAQVLQSLLSGKHNISAVVTAVDKKKGRGQKIGASPVKVLAQKKKLAVLQPEDLRDSEFLRVLKDARADLFVLCAYGKILTKEVLGIPAKYAINLHTSLLPAYRGAAPINRAIINGERETGVTIFKMDKGMDTGEIILQAKTTISASDTAASLAGRLAGIGAEALLKAIGLIECGKVKFTAQDEARASLAPKLKKEEGLIDWQSPALDIHNRIRGLQPWPGAFTWFRDRRLKIWQSRVVKGPSQAGAGTVADVRPKEGILVQAGRNKLLLISLQPEGKKRMSASEFISGHNIKAGETLGKGGEKHGSS
jgi:methionyl-tRNA formyltransferase